MGLLNFTGWQLTAGGLLLTPVTLLAEGLPGSVTGANAAGFGHLGLDQALSPLQILGALTVIAAVVLAQPRHRSTKAPQKASDEPSPDSQDTEQPPQRGPGVGEIRRVR